MANLTAPPTMHILLADDNDANCLVARTILERAGHSVVTARNGDEALNLTKSAFFDLIILDVLMPVMNGLNALQRIRQENSPNRNTPIFALLAYSDTQDRQRYSSAGFDAILSKPLRSGDLEDVFSHYKNRTKSVSIEILKKSSADRVPVLDDDRITQLRRCGRPNELEETQIRLWRSIHGQCERITIALSGALEGDRQNLSEFRRAVHSIKGASTSIGLTRVTDIAQRLRNAPPNQIPGLMHIFLDALGEGRHALKQALSGTRQFDAAMQMGREDQTEAAHHSQNDGSAIRN